MIRYYIFLTGLFLTPYLKAQLSKSFSLNFKTGAYALTPDHRQVIDSVIRTLSNIPEGYIAEIKGRTDNKGSLEQNTELSKNRAISVLNYLKNKHFKSTDTSIKFYAYNHPLTPNSENNLWRNRRVEINLYARKLDMVKILSINDFAPNRYKFIEDDGGTLTYDSTSIVIAPNSFLHQNGTEVSGEIDITYIEYRTPSDFLLSGIPMSIQNGDTINHFNSGGMFHLVAFQNGEQLVLKKEKTVYLKFPLSNTEDQAFYQFNSATDASDPHAAPITNPHGDLLFPFGSEPVKARNDKDSINLFYCMQYHDACSYVTRMLNKLKYYLNHEEPIRFTYPYKFVKNNLVDFKSPFYAINIDRGNNTLTFVPKNSHNKLDAFTNYVWTYKPKDLERASKYNFEQGASFVKISNRSGNKFKLMIENEALTVTGEPVDFRKENGNKKYFFSFLFGNKEKAIENKLKKINKRNYKKYQAYIQEADRQEIVLENQLRQLDNQFMPTKNNMYGKDSLDCLGYFYNQYLYTADEKKVVTINDFNINKEKLAAKVNALPSPFTCKDIKRLLDRKDSIAGVVSARRIEEQKQTRRKFAEFGINATGIYNADQIKAINNPVEIYATYKTENNQPLKIISIFASIKGLNGIINYNGYANYGPYKFVYGKNDQTMLVAVDDEEKSYYCTPTEFAAFVNAKRGKQVNFVLKPLHNLASAVNLEKIVSN